MFTAASLDFESTAPVVRQLDQQILLGVEDECLSAAQQAELLAWVHAHLLSAYVAFTLDALALVAGKPMPHRRILACRGGVETISLMLEGGLPLGEDLTFACPPVCCRGAQDLGGRLAGWVRRRVVLAAQRTRWHTEAELACLWEAVEAHLITGAIVEFELSDLLEVDVPAREALEATTRRCLEAMRAARDLSWTPAGAALP